jgi:hypothetical protein
MEKMTTVNNTNARNAIILLALNFVFTGYAITKLASMEDAQPPPSVKGVTEAEADTDSPTE